MIEVDKEMVKEFICACIFGAADTIIKFLEENKSQQTLIKDLINQALVRTVAKNFDKCLQTTMLLISYGADINYQDTKGCTALHYALDNKAEDVINYLLSVSGSQNDTDKLLLDTTLEASSSSSSSSSSHIDANLDIDANSNIDEFQRACFKGETVRVKELLEQDKCEQRFNPEILSLGLIQASFHNHLDIVKALTFYGVNIDFVDTNGKTALDYATEFGHGEIMNHLFRIRDIQDPNLELEPAQRIALFMKVHDFIEDTERDKEEKRLPESTLADKLSVDADMLTSLSQVPIVELLLKQSIFTKPEKAEALPNFGLNDRSIVSPNQ